MRRKKINVIREQRDYHYNSKKPFEITKKTENLYSEKLNNLNEIKSF